MQNRSINLIAAVVGLICAAAQLGRAASPITAGELLHDVNADSHSTLAIVLPPRIPNFSSHNPSHVLMMEVTAYCACPKCCGPRAAGITASGRDVKYNDGRFVAADTAILPFGSKLMIPGYDSQPVEVIDRGSAIRGNRLDVFFPSHEQAIKWGRQMIAVTVVE